MESTAKTQNLFSIFNSKFKNAPGKIAKKRRVRKVAASKLNSDGIRKLDKYFNVGKEDEAIRKFLSDDG